MQPLHPIGNLGQGFTHSATSSRKNRRAAVFERTILETQSRVSRHNVFINFRIAAAGSSPSLIAAATAAAPSPKGSLHDFPWS